MACRVGMTDRRKPKAISESSQLTIKKMGSRREAQAEEERLGKLRCKAYGMFIPLREVPKSSRVGYLDIKKV